VLTSARYLADESDMYFGSDKHLEELDAYPPNESLREIAAGLAEGWKAYGEEEAVVLFVVQDGERNVFDQRWLQYELLEEYVYIHFRYGLICV
jgi:glutathione synthase